MRVYGIGAIEGVVENLDMSKTRSLRLFVHGMRPDNGAKHSTEIRKLKVVLLVSLLITLL